MFSKINISIKWIIYNIHYAQGYVCHVSKIKLKNRNSPQHNSTFFLQIFRAHLKEWVSLAVVVAFLFDEMSVICQLRNAIPFKHPTGLDGLKGKRKL